MNEIKLAKTKTTNFLRYEKTVFQTIKIQNLLKGNVYIIIQSDEYGYSYMGMW